MSSRVGVLGSICNPPHLGHATLARCAAEQLGLERVLLIPTGSPAHRDEPGVSPQVRLQLAEAAARDEPMLEASAIEVEPDLERALDRAVALTPAGGEVVVLPTYTAMLALRRIAAARGHVRNYWEPA